MFLTTFLTACVRVLPVLISGQNGKPLWCHFSVAVVVHFFFLFPLQGNIQSKRCTKSNAETDLPAAQGNFLPIQKEENPGSNLGYTQGLRGAPPQKVSTRSIRCRETDYQRQNHLSYVCFSRPYTTFYLSIW